MGTLRLWLPVVLYCGMIFYMSSMETLPDLPAKFTDKIAHFVVYSGLGWLVARATSRGLGLSPLRTIISASLVCLAYGISDELHQSFVPGRAVEVGDVLADFIGGLAGAYLYGEAARWRKKSDAGA
ncbi:MAG: VanZ family protein [Thermodesulfobacteriota bacterium]